MLLRRVDSDVGPYIFGGGIVNSSRDSPTIPNITAYELVAVYHNYYSCEVEANREMGEIVGENDSWGQRRDMSSVEASREERSVD